MSTGKDVVIIFPNRDTASLDGKDWKEFQELLRRGAECWPDASPNMKALVDLIIHGSLMQNYWEQAGVAAPDPLPPMFGDRNHE